MGRGYQDSILFAGGFGLGRLLPEAGSSSLIGFSKGLPHSPPPGKQLLKWGGVGVRLGQGPAGYH